MNGVNMIQETISYEQIRERKQVEYGTQFKDWIWIFVKQYKDRTHFLFELLQNAEDAKATEVRLSLRRDMLVIEHNGILFSKEDVISITKVAKSNKSGGGSGSIGRFGIGFKSVYAYAATPRIYSGRYSFEIRDFIYPYEIKPVGIQSEWTRIEIPFNNSEVAPEKAFSEIRRALSEQIRSDTLLFLNNISNLSITYEGSDDLIRISKEDRERRGTGGSVLDVNILYKRRNKQQEDNYLLFTDCEAEAVCLAFKVEGQELVPVPNTSIFTFFPTDKESHQSFYIHAPFETTPARDNIVEDSEKNRLFVRNICDGLRMAFCWMRDNGYLTLEGMNSTYPIYKYPEDTVFYEIYQTAIQMIASGEKLIPTNQKGVFKSRTEILLPDNMSIVEIFGDEDIHRLFMDSRIYWITKEISQDKCQQFRIFLRSNFNFKLYTWRDVINKLDAGFLAQKDVQWFEALFKAIRTFAVNRREKEVLGSHEIDVSRIPFVRTHDRRQICAYEDKHPVVYINNPEACVNKIHDSFIQSNIIRTFLTSNLNIPAYNVVTIVKESVLPKYSSQTPSISTENLKENIRDLKTIKDALQTDPGILEKIQGYYLVTDGKKWYKPTDLHIPSEFAGGKMKPEFDLVSGVCELHYISNEYAFDPKLDEKFFVSIGCADSLRKMTIGIKEYLDLVQRYIGTKEREEIRKRIFTKTYKEGINWNLLFEGFPKAMYDVDKKNSRRIARFLNKNITQITIRGEIHGANDQSFSGANVDSMSIYSALGLLLSFIPWIYTKDGSKKTVTEIHRAEVDDIYEKEAKRLLDKLSFVEDNNALKEILASLSDESQKEMVKEILTNPDSMKMVTNAWKNKKIKELKEKEKKKKSPSDILSEMSKKKAKGAPAAKGDTLEAINNLEKRRKKLENEFGESMDFKINVAKTTLKYTFQDRITSEEKSFLDIQYNGYCQICGTTILKYDGKHHFQAINVMKTSELADKYKGALETGWNSLCLCPNCAAKYRYGVKDVSGFYDQVQEKDVEAGSEEPIDIQISLQDKKENIHYSPKHFLALKTAMEMFSE